MKRASTDHEILRLVEEWTGHRSNVKPRKRVIIMKISLTLLAAIAAAIAFSSCAGITAGLSGAPVTTVPVQRVDNPKVSFDLAVQDVARAEHDSQFADSAGISRKAWGLYNASAVAARTAEVVDTGK